ncbi:MAG: cupin [Paracoccaceae bacterium]
MDGEATAGTATGTVLIENGRTRVTEWRFPARGDNTGWHRHEHDYVIVPLFDGALEIRQADGATVTAPMRHGAPYFRERGVEHDVLSANDFDCGFIEIEFLEPPSG